MSLDALRHTTRYLRGSIIEMIHRAHFGGTGASLSVLEILVSLYFGYIGEHPAINIDVTQPHSKERDFVILSKSIAAPALYATLALRGFFDESELRYFGAQGSMLLPYPSMRVPGVDATTGLSGLGFSQATGLAYALKKQKKENKVYCVMGDEELQEGLSYESMLFAGHHHLDNLMVFVDRCKIQHGSHIHGVLEVDSIVEKFKSCGFEVVHVVDGHNFDLLLNVFARGFSRVRKPTMVICHTISGKGIPFAENKSMYYGCPFSAAEMREARRYVLYNKEAHA